MVVLARTSPKTKNMKISFKLFKSSSSILSETSSRSVSGGAGMPRLRKFGSVTDVVSTKTEDHAAAVRVRRPSSKSPSSSDRFDDAADAVSEHHTSAASQVSQSPEFDNVIDVVSEHDHTAAQLRRPSLKSQSSLSRFDDAADELDEHHTSAARLRRPSLTSLPSSRSVAKNCPFRHGTVYADPYPGYIHGNPKRGICPNGCRPLMTSEVTKLESPRDVLLREAIEFINLYYHERSDEMQGTDGFLSCDERISAIKESIYATGTYVHTFDELQHGARVAWRNAPKCSNRKYWQQLKLLDQRTATSNKEMFNSCIQHLSKAVSDPKRVVVCAESVLKFHCLFYLDVLRRVRGLHHCI